MSCLVAKAFSYSFRARITIGQQVVEVLQLESVIARLDRAIQ
jgi:hypothetical protein